MPERDANQLATDVREALITLNVATDWQRRHRKVGIASLDELVALAGTLQQERDEAVRLRGVATEWAAELAGGKRAAEARAEALQQERDKFRDYHSLAIGERDAWAARAEAAEAQVAALTPKADAYDRARATVKTEGNTRAYYMLRAEAAEAALAEQTLLADERARERDETDYSLNHCRGLLDAAEAALATTREALTEIAALRSRWELATPDEPFDTVESFWDALGIADRALADAGGDIKEPA